MKVVCKQITSEGFDLREVTTVLTNQHDYSAGGYGLELGREYVIIGIALYKDANCLYYMIDINGRPDWFPYLLFDVIDNALPEHWFVRMNGKRENSDIYCLWGFEELCNQDEFYDRLTNRDKDAMRIYRERKLEIERYFQERF